MPTVAKLQITGDLNASITSQGVSELVPSGVVMAFAGATAPTGWLLCNGSAISRTTYANLFAAIGVAHGYGDNSTTFNLPNYAGRFLRGRANGSANDPDRASRTAAATGGNTGDAVGSVQATNYSQHRHLFSISGASGNNPPANPSELLFSSGNTGNSNSSVATITATGMGVFGYNNGAFFTNGQTAQIAYNGGSETRPLNAYVNYIIKI